MMISPESYYDLYFKGKSETKINMVIASLKRQKNTFIDVMEHPEYGTKEHINPSVEVQLWCTRLYIEKGKEALMEMGAKYEPSEEEIKDAEFQSNLPYLEKIEFSIGGFHQGQTTYIVDLTKRKVQAHCIPAFSDETVPHFIGEYNEPYSTEYFLYLLSNLHIGEWLNEYDISRFGYAVLDGTQWKVLFHFSNGAMPKQVCGSNSYPYNFKQFCEWLGIDNYE